MLHKTNSAVCVFWVDLCKFCQHSAFGFLVREEGLKTKGTGVVLSLASCLITSDIPGGLIQVSVTEDSIGGFLSLWCFSKCHCPHPAAEASFAVRKVPLKAASRVCTLSYGCWNPPNPIFTLSLVEHMCITEPESSAQRGPSCDCFGGNRLTGYLALPCSTRSHCWPLDFACRKQVQREN